MKVLSVASEAVPFIKTGGLADVAGALPAALALNGVEMRLLLPGYPAVAAAAERKKRVRAYANLFGGPANIMFASHGGRGFYYLDAPHLFERPGTPYLDPSGRDWPDNWRRFAAFSRAAADLAIEGDRGWKPGILHAHDWQAALSLAYLHFEETRPRPASVLTVHNLAFQGRFESDIFPSLGLPLAAHSMEGVEYFGGVGFLKAGLQYASAITTVSPTYAQEIRHPASGMGLHGLIDLHADRLHGILNGIDTNTWDPQQDGRLAARYSARNLGKRLANKRAVERKFALDEDGAPLLCVISRLTWQKGMDILAARIDDIVRTGVRIAVLGSGDHALEGAMLAAAARHPGRVGVIVGYDEPLSHLMQGGCDAILIPSRFEPCGLTQLYGLRYGCIPLVARTGGLADTVIDANEAALSAQAATGIVFPPDDGEGMVGAVERLVKLYHQPAQWSAMQRAAMRTDVSWAQSAARYGALYNSLSDGN